jgi:hypothetical protein
MRLLVLLFMLALPASAGAVSITSIQTATNVDAISFTVAFSGAPDFFTIDQFNRQFDSFQIYLFDLRQDPRDGLIERNVKSVVRGSEIHLGNGLPIRNVGSSEVNFGEGHSDYPHNGWGSIRETVQFRLTDRAMTYTASLSTLNVGNAFGYAFESYRSGSTTANRYDCSSDGPCSVPVPAMLWPTALMLMGLFAVRQRLQV